MVDYTSDVALIIGDWGTRVTLKRDTETFSDTGAVTHTWGDITTADVDIQPATVRQIQIMMELGIKEMYTFMIYGYDDTSGSKITPQIGDRFYDASNKIYDIKHIKEYENSHFEIYCAYLEGKI